MTDWISRSRGYLNRSLGRIRRAWGKPAEHSIETTQGAAPAEDPEAGIAHQARAEAPIVWLVGKVQSGKSSIVRALTGCTDIETGTGFKACTRTAQVFDFPAEAPVIRFLDTRGLAEPGYDPAEDIAACEGQAQLVLAVVRALDHNQDAVFDVLCRVRTRHPEWPVAVAQTSLHDGYPPGANHPRVYPYGENGEPLPGAKDVPGELARSLAAQRRLFHGLPGDSPPLFVPLDFTAPGDGYEPAAFGLEALMNALQHAAPAALAVSLREAHANASLSRGERARPRILGYAVAAGAADAFPAAGLVAVPAVQAKMLHSLARIYGIEWDRRLVGEFAAALGAGTALKALSAFGLRELAKLVPVYGQTAGAAAAAAASFATTFALGKAATLFLERRRTGSAVKGEVTAAYRAALAEAFRLKAAREARGEAREEGPIP